MNNPARPRPYFNSLLAALLCTASSLCHAWGPQGHRLAGALTESFLSPDTRRAVTALLGNEPLAEASTWADRMRDSPSPFWQERAGPYHYVTVPTATTYASVGPPGKGDSVTALTEFRAALQDASTSRAHRQLALRFSLHIIQDLHQPLHVGNGRDRGGNNIKLKLRGKRTNLHRVWDSSILGVAGRSDAEWLRILSDVSPEQRAAWSEPDPMVWIAESTALRDSLYPVTSVVDVEYLQHWLPTVELRLQQSALRAATWLNSVDFAQP